MEKITVEELVKFKLLPFDLYNEKGEKLVNAGEILTSGKLLQINQSAVLYKDLPRKEVELPEHDVESVKQEPVSELSFEQLEELRELEQKKQKDIIFDKTVNRKSKLKAQSQVDMKSYYATTMFALKEDAREDVIQMIDEIKDKILNDVHRILPEVDYCSQLKLLGNYHDCHALNTAILATTMGYKLEMEEDVIEKLAKAALLHDIGVSRLPEELLSKATLSQQDLKVYQKHPQIGYKILKHEMGLPEEICLVALQHHENNDGSGYPFKLSGEQISHLTRIISICSFFDDLTSNKTTYKIKNTKEALRLMLELGSRKFEPQLLYQFVNMFIYSDIEPYDEMIH